MNAAPRRGFALFELLVAVAIFAIMGVIAYRSLAAVTRARAAIASESERLGDAQFAIALLERDLRQAAVRPVRDGFGQPQPALLGTRGRVELTAWAFASPSAEPRAQLARVVYERDDEGLARASYATLDRAPNGASTRRVLAPGVESLRLRYLAESAWRDDWPPQPQRQNAERLPRAVELSLEVEGLGTLRRIVDLVETDAPLQ
jgi:general secretion pathway protein J